MPRRTLPRDSSSVLPCSRVTVAAISSKCSSRSSRKRNIARARTIGRRVAPRRERPLRGGDRGVEVLAGRERRPRDDFAGRRVVDVEELGGPRRHPATADEVGQSLQGPSRRQTGRGILLVAVRAAEEGNRARRATGGRRRRSRPRRRRGRARGSTPAGRPRSRPRPGSSRRARWAAPRGRTGGGAGAGRRRRGRRARRPARPRPRSSGRRRRDGRAAPSGPRSTRSAGWPAGCGSTAEGRERGTAAPRSEEAHCGAAARQPSLGPYFSRAAAFR